LTLDILSISDTRSVTDKTDEWEKQCDERSSPRIKFPLKLKDNLIDQVSMEFVEPVVKEPKEKKSEKNKNTVKVINLSSSKNKDKNKLF
jgi:hypothetical protein